MGIEETLAKAVWAYWDTHGDVNDPPQDCADQAARAALAHLNIPLEAGAVDVGHAAEMLELQGQRFERTAIQGCDTCAFANIDRQQALRALGAEVD